MADLGQLTAHQDDYDLTFKVGQKTYKVKPSVDQVLDFMAAWESVSKGNTQVVDSYTIWELVAPVLGSTFDRETFRFEAGPEGVANHGLVPELIKKGADIPTIGRILSTFHAYYVWGKEVAVEFWSVGDLGKAFRNLRERENSENEANPNPATPPTIGETNADDSETQQG